MKEIIEMEKEKEEQTAALKKAANKKLFAMQVIQAVAQTATSALNAYSSAAAIPPPFSGGAVSVA